MRCRRCRAYGMVLAIWDSYFQCRQWPGSQSFFASVARVIRETFDAKAYCPAHAEMIEVVIPQAAVLRGQTMRTIALAAGFVERRVGRRAAHFRAVIHDRRLV